jgi:hypothetical protein
MSAAATGRHLSHLIRCGGLLLVVRNGLFGRLLAGNTPVGDLPN